MRKAFYLFFVALAGIVSCNKEIVTEPEPAQDGELVKFSITGVLDKELTKTAYDADGKMTWCDGDKAALIVYKGEGYSNQNRNQYTLEAQYNDISVDGRTAVFYGMIDAHLNTSDWLSSGFAVYPAEPVTQINPSNYYNAPYIKVPSSGSMLGLASSIILVGTPNSDVSNFNFKTAMAVLKVNITNIPAEAQAIRLSTSNSDSYPVDGDFTLVKSGDVVTVGLGNYQGWGNGYQSVDISSEGAIAGRDFFFNIPVGTYPANTLSFEVVGASNQVLMKRTIAKALTLERNECLAIPSLLYHRVWVNGSLSSPLLYTDKPSSANTIRVNISSEKLTGSNYNSSNWVGGNKFGASQNGWNLTNLKDLNGFPYLSADGTYYLQYIVSSDGSQPSSLSDATVMAYGSVPFRFDSDGSSFNSITDVIGSYSVSVVDYWDNKSTTSFVLSSSDDSSKGNVMLTQILGHDTAIYGTYQNGVIAFNEDQEWYIDGNGAAHMLINNWSGTVDSTWSLKIPASFDLDLVLGSSYLVNEWFSGENKSYDNIYKVFDSKKQ